MSTWARIIVFCLGLPGRARDVEEPTSTTGFDLETLAPSRQPSTSERLVAAATTLLVLATGCLALVDMGWRSITDGTRAWVYGGAGALWALRMLLPPRLPMDRASIGLGLYAFLPWLPSLVFNGRRGISGLTGPNLSESDLGWLGWHAAGFIVLVVTGLALDIRAEMRAREDRP